MRHDPVQIAQSSYLAYVNKDRAALEALISDRAAYFERCWPNSESIAGFDFIHTVADGDRVFVTYEGRSTRGAQFRNTEILTIRDGMITDAEVYFGWDVPHHAADGGFIEPGE
jgi:ketosteroid isomerase-like protein